MYETFEDWLAEVDSLVTDLIGLTTADLPDRLYRDAYEGGVTPQEMFDEIVEEEGLSGCL